MLRIRILINAKAQARSALCGKEEGLEVTLPNTHGQHDMRGKVL